jgi:hypothetical protein
MEDSARPALLVKKDALRAWTEQVFADAGLTPSHDQVTDIAKSIAGLILTQRLVPLSEARGARRVRYCLSSRRYCC